MHEIGNKINEKLWGSLIQLSSVYLRIKILGEGRIQKHNTGIIEKNLCKLKFESE